MPRIFSLTRCVVYITDQQHQTTLNLAWTSKAKQHSSTMAATRLLRTSNPLHLVLPSSSSSFSNNSSLSKTKLRCQSKTGVTGERRPFGDVERRPAVSVKASVASSESVITLEPQTNRGIDLASLLKYVTDAVVKLLRPAVKRKPWKLLAQMLIERVIIDCRFFTLFAVAGSLLGSVLCFVEGSFFILESYLQYFHTMSQRSDQGHVIQLLIEAIDMYLVGTAMLIFGLGLYVMFVGSKNLKEKGPRLPSSNFFGLFYLKALPTWVGMQSVSQAKSKIGHAVTMILQVGVLEKFRNVPLVTGLDLVCFAGVVLVSSACIFLLSKLSVGDSLVAKK